MAERAVVHVKVRRQKSTVNVSGGKYWGDNWNPQYLPLIPK